MSLPTQLYLLRHGEVEASAQGVFVGARDVELSPRGHEQAAALAAYLAERPMDAVYASPMRRVRQTLAPWQVHRPEPAVIDLLPVVGKKGWRGRNRRSAAPPRRRQSCCMKTSCCRLRCRSPRRGAFCGIRNTFSMTFALWCRGRPHPT